MRIRPREKCTLSGVSISHVTKVYKPGTPPASNDINLDIESGEFFILLGPSGCGKSTLLRMIAGLERATSGEIRIGERLVDGPGTFVEPKNRDIAMVFQSYALYPHMTVFENMAFGLKLRKTPQAEIQKRVEDAAEMLGLTPLLQRLPKDMSGGQRQRVALGRALVRQPKVFLLDEPLSNLDAKLRGAMRVELKSLQSRLATTMIYVTHDQVEAMTLGDRVAVFNHGELQQFGPPLEIYNRPKNRFVASFLGSPPMNFMSGKVEAGRLVLNSKLQFFLPERLKSLAKDGQQLEMGIRPEKLKIGKANAGMLKGEVIVVEALGDHTDVHLRLNGETNPQALIVARCDEDSRPKRGDMVSLLPEESEIHLFDKDTGANLTLTLPPVEADS